MRDGAELAGVRSNTAPRARTGRSNMFMEGDVDWVLVLGVVASVTSVIAILALIFAVTDRTRHVSTSDELGAVSKAREAADAPL
jgi:uncharacterized membrane protein